MSSKSPGLKRKQMMVRILMLDDTEVPFQIEPKMIGNDLINLVYEYLKLVESDYFGLEFYDSKGKKCWLDYDKLVTKQVQYESKLIFGVKFYTPDPGQLEEEYTRYLYALQIKRDLAEGLLLCSDATASLLVSYILQAEIGDFSDVFNDDPNYIMNKRYFPHQNEEHVSKIIEYHKSHIGQTPADADLNLLDIARKVELYGIVMHPAKDHENVQLNLAVANMGILVFQSYTKINTFSWAKIRKLSFRRKKFLVKLHSENYGFYKDTVEFYFDNRDDSKSFWKKCIEHHSFFRCISIMRIPRQKSKLFATRGSSFRYYGRTQKELIENARENFSKNRSFDRSYHSIRSIVTGHREPGQINGTQSLNRNLASRSAGALMIPTAGGCGSSTLSSNDSDHHYNLGLGQNTSSSAHHLSFNTDQSLKTPAIYAGTNKSMISLRSLNDQRPGNNTNLPFINSQLQDHDNPKKQRQNYHGDVAAHGSRTIDSRHSNDKTLGLSDDDDDDLDGDEEDEIDGDFDEEEKNRLNNEKLNFAKSVNDFESCTCGKEHHNDKERKKESDEAKNESEINKSMPNYLNELGNKKLVENISQENATNSIIPQNTSPVKTNHLKLQTGIPDHQYYHIHQKDLIKLPITQEKKPKEKVKLEIINSSSPSTDNEVVLHKNTLPNNPNKIYSRKEVVTTSFKEEIKKSHLEEYRQTTTIYDSTYKPTSESSSSFKPQAADNISNVQNFSNGDYPQICTTQNNALELKQPHSNEIQKKQRSIDQLNHDKRDIDRFISDDNDDEASKNDRASIAARILYSNVRYHQSETPNKDCLKRPSSLSKSLIPSSQHDHQAYMSINAGISYNQKLSIENVLPSNSVLENDASDDKESNMVSIQNYQQIRSKLSNPENIEDEFKRKKNGFENRKSYAIVKELVMTERTYKKDLHLLTDSFRKFFESKCIELKETSFFKRFHESSLDSINKFHEKFLKELELRLFIWNDKSNLTNDHNQKIGDVILNLNQILQCYDDYISSYSDILNELDSCSKRIKKFETIYNEFESQKLCYLPFTMFMLKPMQRLIHYNQLLERLLNYYGRRHHDYEETFSMYKKLQQITNKINESLFSIENKQKLMDLQKDLIGIENITLNSKYTRHFIREGSLQKLSRKGYQQRMFFLFNDILLYCARSSTSTLQFKVHGEYHLKKIQIEDGNSHINIPNSFTIYSANRSLLVSAVTREEKDKWLSDLFKAIENAKTGSNEDKQHYLSLKSNSSSDNNLDSTGAELDENIDESEKTEVQSNSDKIISSHRANTTMHVCWHRNTSVSFIDNHSSLVNQLSGYLLRKFKNSNGWQKLWVVFSNFCLFFYKTYQDEFPLASLPLLGYIITNPSSSDNISKEYVFKLKFKNHVYFFRAEGNYSFNRWLEVLESAAQNQYLIKSDD